MGLDWDRYANFSEKEMACKGKDCCGGQALMDADFMALLQSLRAAVDEPLVVTSAYRCEEHNNSIKGGIAHPTGRAVDIKVNGRLAYSILKLAFLYGFTGVGLKIHGDDQFIHLDTLTPIQAAARPNVWTY